MDKNQNINDLTYFKGQNPKFRHLHPSIYKKIRNTKKLIENNVKPEDFVDRGGLDIETYEVLQQIWEEKSNIIEENNQEIMNKYGSISNTTSHITPCNKISPVIGEKNALVLLVEFKDKKNNTSPQHFSDLLFNTGYQYSMRNYYLETSWNQLNINGYVNPIWYEADNIRSYYVDRSFVNGHFINAQNLVHETVELAMANNINFNDYAKNGEIELLIVIYAGSGIDTKLDAKFIRPHTDRLMNPIEVENGIWVKNYCIIPELPSDDVGCFCHEMGHLLGLPDLYKEGYSPIVGGWCLMGVGDHNNGGRTPAHLSAWCKIHLGWTKPVIITEKPKICNLSAVNEPSAENKIYKIPINNLNSKEYFLIENRQQKGFDQGLPASGILIWHVNENNCIYSTPNQDPQNFFLTLEQSDGQAELEKNMLDLQKIEGIEESMKDLKGDNGDPFPGVTNNRLFDDKSTPSSRTSKNKNSCVVIDAISNSDLIMNANMGITCNFHELNDLQSKDDISYLSPEIIGKKPY